MKEIQVNTVSTPVFNKGDFCIANESFVHADRILDFHVMIYVRKGCIYVTEESDGIETDYEIHEGELLFLKAGNHHYGKRECSKGTSWYYAHFQLQEMKKLPIYENRKNEGTSLAAARYSLWLPKKLKERENGRLGQAFKEFLDYCDGKKDNYRWYVNMKLFQLLSEIALESDHEKIKRREEVLADQIAEYLETHWKKSFSSKDLGSHFYLSYKYMAAVFKAERKCSMQEYHTKMRMEHAAKMLRSTTMSICQISEEIGYHDMLYFSKCFHKQLGMSPTKYRKSVAIEY